ncbi:unannotated protein [freshwater metagenome]|uniref:Unannotated protein n=1 Tax=freshwater metagenome TaxID=449393 RepID=A0A6J7T1D5_9ZZZZ
MVITCGLNSRTISTSGALTNSSGRSAKQPFGSGGLGSPSGQPESSKPSQRCEIPKISAALCISVLRTCAISRSPKSKPGFKMSPRSPPVQLTTITCTPSLTYFAVEAAPLLDSSSGWACTANSRSGSSGRGNATADSDMTPFSPI